MLRLGTLEYLNALLENFLVQADEKAVWADKWERGEFEAVRAELVRVLLETRRREAVEL